MLVCVTAGYSAEHKSISIVTGDYLPFSGERLKDGGPLSVITTMVFKNLGYSVKISYVPWLRCEYMIQKNIAWGAFPYTKTPERLLKYNYSDPLITSKYFLYYYENPKFKNMKYEKITDLLSYKVGAVAGYFYEYDFKKYGIKGIYSLTEEISFTVLKEKRIEIFPCDENVANYIISKNYPDEKDKFEKVKGQFGTFDFGIISSKDYPDGVKIINEFNMEYRRLLANGKIKEIFKAYNISD